MNTVIVETLKHLLGVKDGKYVVVTLKGTEATVEYLSMKELSNVGCLWLKGTPIVLEDDDIAKTILSVYEDRLVKLDEVEIVDNFKDDKETIICVEVTGNNFTETLSLSFISEWENFSDILDDSGDSLY